MAPPPAASPVAIEDRSEKGTEMDEIFGVTEESDGRSIVVTLSGEIDVAAAPTVRERLEQAASGDGTLIVDLTGVSFIDSTALGVLIGVHKQRAAAEADMRLVVSEPRILKVFEITGLTDLFVIVPSLAEAKSS
jgi:anti-sigma B factor antagonist